MEKKLNHLFSGDIFTIFIVRHPEVENHNRKVFNGSIDVGLSENGIKQAEKLFETLRESNIKTVFSSPMKRCRAVAERFRGGSEIIYDKRLKERNFGIFESLSWEEITEKYPKEAELFLKHPFTHRVKNGESFRDLKARIIPFIEEHLSNPSGNILVVAHGGVNRIIISSLLMMSDEAILRISQDYACINIFETDGSFFLCRLLNGKAAQRTFL